jgi:hypothetical protein
VLGDLRARLLAGEAQAGVVAAFVDWALLPTRGPDPAALTAYTAQHLSPPAAAAADALVARMTRADVRETMWAIGDVAAGLGGDTSERALAPGVLFAVNCAEEIAFDTPAPVQRYLDAWVVCLTGTEPATHRGGVIVRTPTPPSVGARLARTRLRAIRPAR